MTPTELRTRLMVRVESLLAERHTKETELVLALGKLQSIREQLRALGGSLTLSSLAATLEVIRSLLES